MQVGKDYIQSYKGQRTKCLFDMAKTRYISDGSCKWIPRIIGNKMITASLLGFKRAKILCSSRMISSCNYLLLFINLLPHNIENSYYNYMNGDY